MGRVMGDLRWIGANAAALALANAAVPGVFRLAWTIGLSDVVILASVGAVWGVLIGGAQALVRRRQAAAPWVALTMLGLIFGWVWTLFVGAEDILAPTTLWSQTRDALQFGAVLGAGLGLLQWAAWRRLGVGWVIRNALGWALAMVVLNVVSVVAGPVEGWADIAARLVFGAMGGAVIGVVTGWGERRR